MPVGPVWASNCLSWEGGGGKTTSGRTMFTTAWVPSTQHLPPLESPVSSTPAHAHTAHTAPQTQTVCSYLVYQKKKDGSTHCGRRLEHIHAPLPSTGLCGSRHVGAMAPWLREGTCAWGEPPRRGTPGLSGPPTGTGLLPHAGTLHTPHGTHCYTAAHHTGQPHAAPHYPPTPTHPRLPAPKA